MIFFLCSLGELHGHRVVKPGSLPPLPFVGISHLQPSLGLLQGIIGPRHRRGHEGRVVLQLALLVAMDAVAEPGSEEGPREVDLNNERRAFVFYRSK